MFNTDEFRQAVIERINTLYGQDKAWQEIVQALSHPFFPMTFFLRNLSAIQREKSWGQLSPEARKTLGLELLKARCSIFIQTMKWLKDRNACPTVEGVNVHFDHPLDHANYCSHCGGCCEIASGYREFFEDSEIPVEWKEIYGNGLGKGHRFCAFLWEMKCQGKSICPIHPWRAKTCRVFEKDECDFFLKDADFIEFSKPEHLREAGDWLLNLIDGRKLPLG